MRVCFRKCYVGAMPLSKTKYSELAQLAEHLTVNQVVAGSSPAFGAKTKGHQKGVLFVLAVCLWRETVLSAARELRAHLCAVPTCRV